MFKKFVSIVALVFTIITPTLAQAVNLDSMFGSLTGGSAMSSSDAAGVYKSASRNVVSGGGFDMRVPPRNTVSLFSITPPTLNAGCNGISAHFGGFSFITGGQIEKFIQNIIQGAPGLVMQLAIKVLCAQCEAVLQVMQSLAQRAAKLAMDSCSAGQQLEKLAESKLGVSDSTDNKRRVCGTQVTARNGTGDMLSSLDSVCSSVQSSVSTIEKDLKDAVGWTDGETNPAKKAAVNEALAMKHLKGNETWEALKLYYKPDDEDSRRTMVLLMNLVGTVVHTDGATAAVVDASAPVAQAPTDKTETVIPRNVSVKFLYDLFMCGTPQPGFDLSNAESAQATVQIKQTPASAQYCGRFYGNDWANQKIYDCGDGDYESCQTLNQVAVKDAKVIQGAGLLYKVNTTLAFGVNLIRTNNNNQPIDWENQQVKDLAAILHAAPYPLYQAINAAAVYPAAAIDLVDSLSVMTAELMAYHIIDSMLLPTDSTGRRYIVNQALVDRLYEALGAMHGVNREQLELMGQQLAVQEGISRRIFQINQTIQRQVMSDDFLGNTRFGSAVAAGVTNSSK